MLTSLVMLVFLMGVSIFSKFNLILGANFLAFVLLSVILSTLSFSSSSVLVGLMFEMESFSVLISGLTVFVVILMLLVSQKYEFYNMSKVLFSWMNLSLCLICLLFFMTDNLLTFYIFFEMSLIPTLVLILKWGYQPERLQAGSYFMMYTISASLPLLFTILVIQTNIGTLEMNVFYPCLTMKPYFSSSLLQLCLLMAFLVKVPMWGVHLWLPKAHVEAPVSGSMILAGILLKLGGYGLFKIFSYLKSVEGGIISFILSINLWGMVAVSLVCLRQVDVKSLIAYSSVIHMGLMVVGILSYSITGWLGAMVMMLAHGFSSPGMFAMANFNYEASGSRVILLQKGLMKLYPVSAMVWFLLLAANMAAPPSMNLAGEIYITASVLKLGFFLFPLLAGATFLSAAYNLYLYSSQQGSSGFSLNQGSGMKSNMMLGGLSHVIPVYFCIFCLFLL